MDEKRLFRPEYGRDVATVSLIFAKEEIQQGSILEIFAAKGLL